MAYQTGTATSHSNFFSVLRTFLKTTLGWTELAYDAGQTRMFLRAPGLSGTEEIHIGFKLYQSVADDTFGIYGWMARAWDPGLDMEVQPGHSGLRFHPLWDTATPYWLMGNGQRVIFTTKVSTTYWSSYAGKFLQYGTAGEYGQPYYIGMPFSSAVRFSTINESVRSFFDPGNGALMLTPSGEWYEVRNFEERNSAESEDSDGIWVHPYTTNSDDTRDRFRELRDNLDGSYSLFPLILLGYVGVYDMYGELDGAMAVPGFSTASEDTITVGADTWLIFQNGFRTTRYYYCAIKAA